MSEVSSTNTAIDEHANHLPPKQPFWSAQNRPHLFSSLKPLLIGLTLITVWLWFLLPFFWGSVWVEQAHFKHLTVLLVDFESPLLGANAIVGPALVQAAQQNNQQPAIPPRFTYVIEPASNFENGVSDVQNAVAFSHHWAAVVINSNCTSQWTTSLENGIPQYDPSGCVAIYTAGARFYQIVDIYVNPLVQQFVRPVLEQTSSTAVSQYINSISGNATALTLAANVPQAIGTGFGYYTDDLRPMKNDVRGSWAAAAPFEAAMIYYIIFTFMFMTWGNAARQATGWNTKNTFVSLWAWRILVPTIAYFFFSLFFSIVIVAFQIPITAAVGKAGFVVLWMLNWLAMLALGLALETTLCLLTQKLIPFFLMLLIIFNITSSFTPIELMPAFYRFLRFMPFYHIVEAYKILFYHTRETHVLGLHFGVLIAWFFVNMIAMALFLPVEIKREEKAAKAKLEQNKKSEKS